MRKYLFVIWGFILSATVLAGPVTLQQAQLQAQQFMNKKGRALHDIRLAKKQLRKETAQRDNAYYYVFNVGEKQGFVIVSGDDRTQAILGYADKGSFSDQDIPDNMRAWLSGYEDQMRWMDQTGYQGRANALQSETKMKIDFLLTTKWDQGNPYNLKCPVFLNGNRCVTGCVATAMAQALYYQWYINHNQYPDILKGTMKDIEGYNCGRSWNGDHISVGRKGITEFDWDNMSTSYTGNETGAQQEAVATLMEYCGASVKMDYADVYNGGSSASLSDVVPALQDYFKCEGTYVSRDNYTYQQWQDLIYSELAESRPVVYGGQSSGGGHAFVIDGYDNGLFHVNWGWGGTCNGDFVLSVLNPGDNSGIGASTSNDGYSFGQEAVIGLQPTSVGPTSEVGVQMTIKNIEIFEGNGDQEIRLEAWNYTGRTYTFNIGFCYMNEQGDTIVDYRFKTDSLLNNWGYPALRFPITKPARILDGTYKLIIMSKVQTESDWLSTMNYENNYIVATFNNGVVTLTRHEPIISLSINSNDFDLISNGFKDQKQTVNVQIQNNGDEFYGPLYFFASHDGSSQSDKGGVTIMEGESTDMQFSFTPTATGTWNLKVTTDEEGTKVIGNGQVEIGADPYNPQGDFMVSNLLVDGAVDWEVDADGNRVCYVIEELPKNLNFYPTIKNISGKDVSSTRFNFLLQKKKSDGSWSYLPSYYHDDTVSLSANGECNYGGMSFVINDYGTYRFVLVKGSMQNLNNLDVQDNHYVVNIAKGVYSLWNTNGEKTVNLIEGDNGITLGKDLTAVDLSKMSGINVTLSDDMNPNCLYFFADDATIPDSFDGKNVVSGTTAGNISLTDGYPFYTPFTFTAMEASYTRTFTNGYAPNGSGWNTITLPFAVDNVTTGGNNLDWCHYTTDTGKDFYLMEFVSDNGSVINFNHAVEFKAYTPYIIGVPGADYGEWNLVGKEIKFSAANAIVKAGKKSISKGTNYEFLGTFGGMEPETIYKLNDEGRCFVRQDGDETPFRAYFKGTGTTNSSLSITFDGSDSSGIAEVPTSTKKQSGIYDLRGIKVSNSWDSLPKGIYIVNGKKVVK